MCQPKGGEARIVQQVEIVAKPTVTTAHRAVGQSCPICETVHYARCTMRWSRGGLGDEVLGERPPPSSNHAVPERRAETPPTIALKRAERRPPLGMPGIRVPPRSSGRTSRTTESVPSQHPSQHGGEIRR